MQSRVYQAGFEDRLLQSLRPDHRVLAPVRGADGVVRLQPVKCWNEVSAGSLPLIPLKKEVFPPRDVLWLLQGDEYRSPVPPTTPVALIGIAPCDLYALAYLDLVFADDPLYLRRRQKLLLIGCECHPGPECHCPPWAEPPPFDLLLSANRLWIGSAKGKELASMLTAGLADPEELPFPEEMIQGKRAAPENLEQLFTASAHSPLWREVGERCLGCGACSAVCPTCYCYAMCDEALPESGVCRTRQWDNCFFREHALVAGGQNFRRTRADRLRFRFEHKMLGFGSLRGIISCVGCGRCARACPVDIDIAAVLTSLAAGGSS